MLENSNQKSKNFQAPIETLFSVHGAHKRSKMKAQNNSQIELFLHRAKTRKSCSRLDAGLVCEVLSNTKSHVFFEPFASALDMVPWYRCFGDWSRFLGEMGVQRARKKERKTGSKIGASVVSALAAAESTNARVPRSLEWKFRIRFLRF